MLIRTFIQYLLKILHNIFNARDIKEIVHKDKSHHIHDISLDLYKQYAEMLNSNNKINFYKQLEQMRNKIYNSYNRVALTKTALFSDNNITDGSFNYCVNNVLYRCCFIDGGSNNLYISYTGANTQDPTQKRIPNFPRWTYHTLYNGSFLGIDDPMFDYYPLIKIGWYYGTKTHSFLLDTLKIIEKVCNIKKISHKNVIFFSSSGGGYAGIYASCFLQGSLSISINPQIILSNYPLSCDFFKNTEIDLSKNDELCRNNIMNLMISKSLSKHIILVNARSKRDWDLQIIPSIQNLPIQLTYGLNIYNNILIWVYDACGNPDPHTAFETKYIFLAINYIANEFKNNRLTEKTIKEYQTFVFCINEFWNAYYKLKKDNNSKKDIEIHDQNYCKNYENKEVISNIVLPAKKNNYNFYKFAKFKKNCSYKIICKCKSLDNIKEITAGIFDFENNRIIKYCKYNINDEIAIYFSLGKNIKGIAFCVYAGICGQTMDKNLEICNLCIYEHRLE